MKLTTWSTQLTRTDAITLFYVTYVAFEIPCSLVLKKFRAGRMIPLLMFGWSIVLIGTGFMHNTGQLYASRLLLGLFESGMFPCLALYLSTFYKPQEQALRISYLFVSSALSGSFGGLFAYALLKMDGVAGLQGWRWLFIIEGCASVAISIFVFFFLPDDFENARFLNEDEKQMMRVRAAINARYNGKPDFDWGQVKKAALDPKLYISCWSQFMADVCSFGLSSFLPLIIKSFGYGTVTTQLLTIPVFFWASCAYIAISWMSDRYRRRAFFMMPACLVTAVGYAVNLGVPAGQRGVLYFSTFLIAPGVYMIVGLNCAWLLNSHAPYYKRAMAIGMNQTIGNTAGIVVSPILFSDLLLLQLTHLAGWADLQDKGERKVRHGTQRLAGRCPAGGSRALVAVLLSAPREQAEGESDGGAEGGRDCGWQGRRLPPRFPLCAVDGARYYM